jgi:hypothetical protein
VIPIIRLFQSYFRHPDPERDAELQECLRRNLECPALAELHLLIEPGDTAPEHPLVRAHPVGGRPTFSDFFRLINETVGPRDVTLIANSDVYLDADGVRRAARCLAPWQCYALSRWDVREDGSAVLYDEPRSQDTWMFRGPIRLPAADFPLGKPGCDNRLAYLLETGPYRVFNPSRDVKTFHLHLTGIRNYSDTTDRIPGPYFHPRPDRLYSVPGWAWARATARVRRTLGLPAPP